MQATLPLLLIHCKLFRRRQFCAILSRLVSPHETLNSENGATVHLTVETAALGGFIQPYAPVYSNISPVLSSACKEQAAWFKTFNCTSSVKDYSSHVILIAVVLAGWSRYDTDQGLLHLLNWRRVQWWMEGRQVTPPLQLLLHYETQLLLSQHTDTDILFLLWSSDMWSVLCVAFRNKNLKHYDG